MRGAQTRTDPKRIACSVAAVVQGRNFPQTGKTEQFQRQRAWPEERYASVGYEAEVPEELQEASWKESFADTGQWRDNRRSTRSPLHPDLRHKEFKGPLWLNNRQKPLRVGSQLATVDAGLKTSSETVTFSVLQAPGVFAANDGHSEVGFCGKLLDDGLISDAVNTLDILVHRRCYVPSSLFHRVLRRCAQAKDLTMGRRVHALIVKSGYEGNAFVANDLIVLYASHGRLEDAMGVFTQIPKPDAYNWATIISSYAKHGEAADAAEAIRLYGRMCHATCVKPDNFLFSAVLKACAAAKNLVAGEQVHAQILASLGEPDRFVQAGLVNMYAKCGNLEVARKLFDKLSKKNLVTWTAMIAGYAQQGMGQEALNLYRSMQQEGLAAADSVTYICLLQACASEGLEALEVGKQLHAEIAGRGLQQNVVLGSSLVNMYAKCGSLEEARELLDKLPKRSAVAWTAVIAGYAQQGMGYEALDLYRRMQQEDPTPPDPVTYVCLLQACANVGVKALNEGKQLHAEIKDRGLEQVSALGASLINMYSKCGSLDDARRLFAKLRERNIVAWNSMIAGYAQQGICHEAMSLYSSMQREGHLANSVTYICLLQACAAVAALPLGKNLHLEIEERGIQDNCSVGAALVNMYAKCGSMYDSQRVFESLSVKTLEAWGALSSGYARIGDSQIVFYLLDRMKLEGIHPDKVTFLSVLTVCSHLGLVDKGQKYFEVMRTDYGIRASAEHFICMVDLLGRAGHLDKALQMAKTMPFPPNDLVWRTLLGACRKWKNVVIGQQAFASAISLDKNDAAAYVLMSNIYASARMWEAATEMQARRMKLGAWKKPGQSWWTDMSGVVHTFLAGDLKHPEIEGIHAKLEQLISKLTKEGYVPHLESSLLDISDSEKQAELCGHSEKLAIAFALTKTNEGTTIRIVKNLRICEDCHAATSFISKVEKRTIICRDASRFHVFSEGRCSCGDYW